MLGRTTIKYSVPLEKIYSQMEITLLTSQIGYR